MTFSRKITTSWLKNFILHGLDAKCSLGTLDFNRPVNVEGIDRLGSTVVTVGSSGPGTSMKCVDLLIRGYDAIKSPRAVKLSAAQRCQLSTHQMLRREGSWITLVLLSVPNARW